MKIDADIKKLGGLLFWTTLYVVLTITSVEEGYFLPQLAAELLKMLLVFFEIFKRGHCVREQSVRFWGERVIYKSVCVCGLDS